MDWKNYIIILVFGLIFFGLGFIIGSYQFGSFYNYIISVWPYVKSVLSVTLLLGIITAVIEVAGFVWRWYEKKEKKKLDHSTDLVEIYLKSKTNTHIDFDRDDCGLQIQIKQLQWDYQIPLKDATFCKFVDIHLLNEYKSIWDNIKKRDEAIEKHNIESRKFLTKIREAIRNKLQVSGITYWNGTGEPPTYYYRHYFLSEIGCRIEAFYKYSIEINRLNILSKKDNNLTICYGQNDWIRSNYDVEAIKNIIIDVIIKEDFDLLKKLYDDAKNKHERFIEDIVKLKICIESNVPLKGKCDICKNY